MSHPPVPYPEDREIVSTRVLPYPREAVFGAWSDRERLARWYGPKGFTNQFEQFEFRPGGVWRFVMIGPEGAQYKNKVVFAEIVPPARIVFAHESPPPFGVVVEFEDMGAQTRVVFHMRFETAELCAKIRTYAPEKNEENFDRLEAELARGA